MKKRTTISTETREVWVIRELTDKDQAANPETDNSDKKPFQPPPTFKTKTLADEK
jgi:hypothetical protein